MRATELFLAQNIKSEHRELVCILCFDTSMLVLLFPKKQWQQRDEAIVVAKPD
jgi:hypothetical protein